MLFVAQPSFISLFRLTVWILSSIDSGEKIKDKYFREPKFV